MLVRPAKRSCASRSSPNVISIRRNAPGLINGKMPSSTNNNATATIRSCHMLPGHGLATRLLHVAEEIGARVHDHDVVLLSKAFLIRAEAAVKRVELGRPAGGAAVDGGGAGIALAAQGFALAVGVCEHDFAFAFGLGANFLRRLRTLGAQ